MGRNLNGRSRAGIILLNRGEPIYQKNVTISETNHTVVMRQIIYFSAFVFFLFSCSQGNQFSEPVSEKVAPEEVKILEKLNLSPPDSNTTLNYGTDTKPFFGRLNQFRNLYFEKKPEFSLEDFEEEWNDVSAKINPSILDNEDAKTWFEMNGTLLQITGKARYAEVMENILLHGFHPKNEHEYKEIEKLVAPYIFTKNVDHIHVNLFTPAEIDYEHTLHGKVKIWQETNYPETEDMSLKFSMEARRYIEVFVRIPEWAEGATVTVKGVKYFAPPGDYACISKKWKEGDVVEIHFPKSRKVAHL